MRPEPAMRCLLVGLVLGTAGMQSAAALTHDAAQHGAASIEDKRTTVKFPKALQRHTLANMRDHMLAIQQIQEALANREYDKAASIAEQRLGMSSLELHGAPEVEKFMPAGMQKIGAEMHRAASRFAIEASSAGATGRLGPSLSALARVTQQCVACHASYRMQ